MTVIEKAAAAIEGRGRRVVFPEGGDDRIRAAAERLEARNLARPIVFGDTLPEPSFAHVDCVLKARPAMSRGMALRLLKKPLALAGAMVAAGEADAMVAGTLHPTARIIEAGLLTIGLAAGIAAPSSFFLMQCQGRPIVFADCAVNVDPSAEALADIAIASAASAGKLLGEEPRVALLSFSTHGSSNDRAAVKVADAARIARARAPGLAIDGELQGDAALNADVARRKLRAQSDVAGMANVLVFPSLDAGNIAYKLLQELGGVQAIGPILQGFARPLSDLSRGASVEDIVATTILLLALA